MRKDNWEEKDGVSEKAYTHFVLSAVYCLPEQALALADAANCNCSRSGCIESFNLRSFSHT